MNDFSSLLLGAVIGAVFSAMVSMFIHYLSLHSVRVDLEKGTPQKVVGTIYRNVIVKNQSSLRWVCFAIPRLPIYGCRVEYYFYNENPAEKLEITGSNLKTFTAKWGSSPEKNTSPIAGMFQSPTIHAGEDAQFNVIMYDTEQKILSPCTIDTLRENAVARPKLNDLVVGGQLNLQVTIYAGGEKLDSKKYQLQHDNREIPELIEI